MSTNAFELTCLLDSLNNRWGKSQIASADIFSCTLYIGTENGTVLQFRVNPNDSPVMMKSNQLDNNKIKQLCVIPPIGRLLVLQNSRLLLLDLVTLEVVPEVKPVKGVSSAYCSHQADFWAIRRGSIRLYRAHATRIELVKSHNCEGSVTSLSLDCAHLCVGTQTDYYILNTQSGTFLKLFSVQHPTRSHSVRVGDRMFLVYGPDSLGIFANLEGVSDRPPIQFVSSVTSMAFKFPYVITFGASGVFIYSVIDQKMKQSLPFTGEGFLALREEQILLVTPTIVFLLNPVEHTKQVKSLMKDGFVAEALDLAQHVVKPTMPPESFESYFSLLEANGAIIHFMKGSLDQADVFFRKSSFEIVRIVSMYDDLLPPHLIPALEPLPFACPPLSAIARPNDELFSGYLHFLFQFLLSTDPSEYSGHKRCVDCALLLLALRLGLTSKLRELIEDGPDCLVEDCADEFVSSGSFHLLALFMYYKHQEREALELWSRLEDRSLKDDLYPGLESISRYAQRMKDPVGVIRFIELVLPHSPQSAIKIYTSHVPPLTLDSQLRQSFFETLCDYPSVLMTFCEFHVFDLMDEDEDTHTRLCLIYIDRAVEAHHSTLSDFKSGDFEAARGRLRSFMLFSNKLRIPDVIVRLKASDLLTYELCLLYGKIGDHRKALDIIVKDLADYPGAEEYCRNLSSSSCNIYQILFDIYIELYRSGSCWAPLVSLLDNSGINLDFKKVIQSLGGDVPYSDVFPLIIRSFRRDLSLRNTKSVQRDLLLYKYGGLYGEWSDWASRSVLIDDDTICSVCGRTISQTVFALGEDGMVCHRFCMNDDL